MPVFVVDEYDYNVILSRVYKRKARIGIQNNNNRIYDIIVIRDDNI
jgi:hypothetical protein